MARSSEQRSFTRPQEAPFFPPAESQPREKGPRENTISAETFLRDQLLGYLDELELQQRAIPLQREAISAHRSNLADFESLLQRTREVLHGFEIRGEAPKSFGGAENIHRIHQRIIALETFLKSERQLETVTRDHQEAGGDMDMDTVAEARSTDQRMQQNPQLIPEYIQNGHKLKAIEQEQKSATVLLQKRLGGDVVPEELSQLAEDPAAGLSIWMRGWENMRRLFNRNYVTTTQLLATYQETLERKRVLEQRRQETRQQIEGQTEARPVARREKINPELLAANEATETLLTKFEGTEKQTDLTGKDWERLALLTSKLEGYLPKARTESSYQNYSHIEKTFTRAKALMEVEQRRAQKDLMASKGDLTTEIIDRGLALFAPPTSLEERFQYRHLHALTQFNPILEELTARVYQAIQTEPIQAMTVENLKRDLEHISPEERKVIVTLVQRQLEYGSRIQALTIAAGKPGVIRNRAALQKSLQTADPDVDVSRLLGIEVISPSLPDTRKKNTSLRLARLVADMEQDLVAHPDQADAIYERLLSIWVQMPADVTSETNEDQKRLEGLFASKVIHQALTRRKKAFLKGYLATTITGSYGAKRSVEAAVTDLTNAGAVKHLSSKYRMSSPEVTDVLTEEMKQAPLKLLPEELRKTIPAEFVPYAESIYRTFTDVDTSEKTLKPEILTKAQEAGFLKRMVKEEGVPPTVARIILGSVKTYREKERRQYLEGVWRDIPSYMQNLFSKEKDLHLAPLLLNLTYLIVQKHKDLRLASNELLNKVSMDEVLETAGLNFELHNTSSTIHKRISNSSANTLIFNPAFERVSERIRARFQKRTTR